MKKKLLYLSIVVAIVALLVPARASAYPATDVYVTPLIAGQHIDVGTVSVWNDNVNLYIQYDTTGGWTLDETHLYVDTVPPESAAPGQFPYMHEELGGVTSDLYTIPLDSWTPGTRLYIAAHGVVCQEGEEGEISLDADTGDPIQVIIAEVTLWAGQHMDAGVVVVIVEGDNLIVHFQTHDGWLLMATHLYVGLEPPDKSAPGQFPYQHEGLEGVTFDEYIIPLQEIGAECDDIIYLAAHAELYKPGHGFETGWGEGDRFGGGWAMYFWATVPCTPPPPPPPPICETAWAYGPYELPGSNWGWYFDYMVQGTRLARMSRVGMRMR